MFRLAAASTNIAATTHLVASSTIATTGARSVAIAAVASARTPLAAASFAAQAAVTASQRQRRNLIVKTLDDVKDEDRVKVSETNTWESRRYFLKDEHKEFSFHNTVLYKGTTTLIWYQHHVEAVFVTKGSGTLELVEPGADQGTGVVHELKPGTAYLLNEPATDRHFLSASDHEDLEVVCAFSPALSGNEDHDADGVYLPDTSE